MNLAFRDGRDHSAQAMTNGDAQSSKQRRGDAARERYTSRRYGFEGGSGLSQLERRSA